MMNPLLSTTCNVLRLSRGRQQPGLAGGADDLVNAALGQTEVLRDGYLGVPRCEHRDDGGPPLGQLRPGELGLGRGRGPLPSLAGILRVFRPGEEAGKSMAAADEEGAGSTHRRT